MSIRVDGIFGIFRQNSQNGLFYDVKGVLCDICTHYVKSFYSSPTKFSPSFWTMIEIKWPKLWLNPNNTSDLDVLHRKDPFKNDSCGRNDCFVCSTDGKGKKICNKENVMYRIRCVEECRKKDVYKGETSYSAYSRGQEHLEKYEKRKDNSMLWNHCQNEHDGRPVKFQMDIIGTYHRDATLRQISEGVEIERTPPRRLMNTRSEWNPSLIPQCTIQRR